MGNGAREPERAHATRLVPQVPEHRRAGDGRGFPRAQRADSFMRTRRSVLLALPASVLAGATAMAQWLHVPTPGVPRTADGKVDMNAPTPRLANGKPDFSGLWENDNPGRYLANVAADIEGDAPFRPWARELLEQRIARRGVSAGSRWTSRSTIRRPTLVPGPCGSPCTFFRTRSSSSTSVRRTTISWSRWSRLSADSRVIARRGQA